MPCFANTKGGDSYSLRNRRGVNYCFDAVDFEFKSMDTIESRNTSSLKRNLNWSILQ